MVYLLIVGRPFRCLKNNKKTTRRKFFHSDRIDQELTVVISFKFKEGKKDSNKDILLGEDILARKNYKKLKKNRLKAHTFLTRMWRYLNFRTHWILGKRKQAFF